jgi:lipopolysaccharide export system permease protein
MARLITSYIFKEMAIPFILSIVLLSATVLLGNILKLLELLLTQGAGLINIVSLIATMIPSFMIYTLPASFLVCVLIACTRLSSDNEIMALKASGVSLYAVIKPVFMMAAVVYVATLLVTLFIYPWGNYNYKKVLFNIVSQNAGAAITEKTFYDKFEGTVLYVNEKPVDSNELQGIFISRKNDDGQSEVVVAKQGRFSSNPEGLSIVLLLKDGVIHRKNPKEDTYHTVSFSGYDLDLGKNQGIRRKKKRPNRELYLGELRENIRKARQTEKGPSIKTLMHLQKRFAMPAVVFVFALLGIPLGLQRTRSGKTSGFGIAIGVLLSYYILTQIIEMTAESGLIPPVLGAWGANIILGLFGLYILRKTIQEKEIKALTFLGGASTAIGSLFSRKPSKTTRKGDKK